MLSAIWYQDTPPRPIHLLAEPRPDERLDPLPQRDHVHALPAAPASPASKIASAATAFFALVKKERPRIAIAAPEGAAGLKGPTSGRVMYRGLERFLKILLLKIQNLVVVIFAMNDTIDTQSLAARQAEAPSSARGSLATFPVCS